MGMHKQRRYLLFLNS